MRTPYTTEYAKRSYEAHLLAQRLFYPRLLGTESISYEEPQADHANEAYRLLDQQLSVDRILKVKYPGLRAPLTHTFQERFRGAKYVRWGDITITEWNENSNTPSELYKIASGWFVYGYHDDSMTQFLDIFAIPVGPLLAALPQLGYGRTPNNGKGQPFVSVPIKALEEMGLVYRQPIAGQKGVEVVQTSAMPPRAPSLNRTASPPLTPSMF